MKTDIWLYGKGWSLDSHDFSRDGTIRYAINEAVLVVPGSNLVVQDRGAAERIARFWPIHTGDGFVAIAITTRECEGAFNGERVALISEHRPNVSTAALALWLIPCRLSRTYGEIAAHLVGFDSFFGRRPPKDALPGSERGFRTYAKCVEDATGQFLKRGNENDYDSINEEIRQAAFWYGIELVDGTLMDRKVT